MAVNFPDPPMNISTCPIVSTSSSSTMQVTILTSVISAVMAFLVTSLLFILLIIAICKCHPHFKNNSKARPRGTEPPRGNTRFSGTIHHIYDNPGALDDTPRQSRTGEEEIIELAERAPRSCARQEQDRREDLVDGYADINIRRVVARRRLDIEERGMEEVDPYVGMNAGMYLPVIDDQAQRDVQLESSHTYNNL